MDDTFSELRISATTMTIDGAWFEKRIEGICFAYNLELDIQKDDQLLTKTYYKIKITGPTKRVKLASDKIEEIR